MATPCAEVRIEVVYAWPEGEDCVRLVLPAGATAGDAVGASGIAARHPEAAGAAIGIFGRKVGPAAVLREGDRVEIYRPLALDPKEARRRRARPRR